ncbi:hypothetical protein ABIB57_005193 [Devosia sp. UYZn731]|uniref:hypothetical protein n=1 Tax=Devosia sp. UYZn731 TaxID=3156345 RepID=UPI003394ADA8
MITLTPKHGLHIFWYVKKIDATLNKVEGFTCIGVAMMAVYERLHPGSRIPRDVVVVTVRQSLGRTVADVAAVDQIADFPTSVPRALELASHWCTEFGLSRIQVILEDEHLWSSDWGALSDASKPGIP